MKYNTLVLSGLFSLIVLLISVSTVFGQGKIRNGGTINNTSTINTSQFNNGKNTVNGVTRNAGTITITSGGGFFNFDSSSTSTGGTFQNYFGNSGTGNLNGAITFSNKGGSFVNDSTATLGGVFQVAGSVSNTSGTITTAVGTAEFNANGAQALPAASLIGSYGVMKVSNGNTKTLGAGTTVVANQVILNNTTLAEGSNTLQLNGATPFSVVSAGALSAATGTTVYNATGTQSVLGGVTYLNLTTQGTGTKTVSGGNVTIAATGTVTNAASTRLDLGTNLLTTSGAATFANSDTIKTAGSVTFGVTPTINGTFAYYAGGAQTVGIANYSNLDLYGAGTKTFPSGTVKVSGNYTVANGARSYSSGNVFEFNSTGAQSVPVESYQGLTLSSSSDTSLSNAKTLSGTGQTLNVAAALTVTSSTTFDLGNNNSIGTLGSGANSGRIRWNFAGTNVAVAGTGITEFYGASNATIAAGTYGNLWFSGTGTKTLGAGIVDAQNGSFALGVTIGNNLTVPSGSTLRLNNGGGTMDLNNDGTLTNNGTITVN